MICLAGFPVVPRKINLLRDKARAYCVCSQIETHALRIIITPLFRKFVTTLIFGIFTIMILFGGRRESSNLISEQNHEFNILGPSTVYSYEPCFCHKFHNRHRISQSRVFSRLAAPSLLISVQDYTLILLLLLLCAQPGPSETCCTRWT